jgi:hypothetical protein
MSKHARALVIGLNSMTVRNYAGFAKLTVAETDARDVAAIARSKGFATKTLLARKATTKAVKAEIAAAAAALKSGDIFLLSFSGHGDQLPDRNRDESDVRDEAWCLYDKRLIDDELAELWAKFKPGVRVLVLSDSCHSGTILAVDYGAFGRARRKEHKAGLKKIQASVLLISACQDNEKAYEDRPNSVFIAALKRIWNSGRYQGDYQKFCDDIDNSMNYGTQRPNLYAVGKRNAAFRRQTPFTI